VPNFPITDKLHLEFVLTERQTMRLINLSDAAEHRLRFEWKVGDK
jgi:hypothetical protein